MEQMFRYLSEFYVYLQTTIFASSLFCNILLAFLYQNALISLLRTLSADMIDWLSVCISRYARNSGRCFIRQSYAESHIALHVGLHGVDVRHCGILDNPYLMAAEGIGCLQHDGYDLKTGLLVPFTKL